jgi:Type IIA topoisomerase (DNA gyrase/topo II, topoisomerase IV), A subunit
MRIKQFIDNEWSAYADYDNRRSLPNLIDGLKITQRKVMFFALSMPKNEKPLKVSQFASKAAADTAYHHGEVSMMSTVVGLAQDHPGSNNYPLLGKEGQFGSRLSAEASSPRYIKTWLHANWSRFFIPVDQEIVEHLYDDDDRIEPKFYIPIIPMVLINGASGVGNGFKSSILNYDIESVVKGLKEIIKYGKVKTPLLPSINGFTGKIEKEGRQVTFTGKLSIVHGTKILITELPPGYDNDKYKKILNKLADDKVIKNYKNHSSEDKWEWIIECPRDTTALGEAKLLEKFGLIAKDTENFVGWGVDASAPLTFETPEALLEYWYAERLKLYDASLKHQIKKTEAGIIRLDLRIRFIQWCLKNDFRKFSKAEFIEKAVAGVKKLTPELASDFVSMPMFRITTDEVKKAELDLDNNLAILEDLEAQTPLILMERNLKAL